MFVFGEEREREKEGIWGRKIEREEIPRPFLENCDTHPEEAGKQIERISLLIGATQFLDVSDQEIFAKVRK